MCFIDVGLVVMGDMVAFYKENVVIFKRTWEEMGYKVYGGIDVFYVWVFFEGCDLWEVFMEIFDKMDIVIILGVGFGFVGNGYVRCSAFGSRENINEVVCCFKEFFLK